jgi:cytochrome oxidase Cu insertion factor (SCO1/SenC/PrrC family)
MNGEVREHRGLALAALGVVGLVTAAWWALALYPTANAPEWVSRTRLACFGAAPGGLPDAGGWILLVFQPVGMLAMLFAVWGNAVRADLRWLVARPAGRLVIGAALGAMTWSALTAAMVIKRVASGAEPIPLASSPSTVSVPPLVLTDQHGQVFDLRQAAAGPVLVTFAFAHCETMCPTQIRDLLRIRSEAGRADIPLVVVTVDPWRDVPSRLPTIAAAWNLAPGDHVLSGNVDEVNAALNAWGIARQRDEVTGDVLHALVAVLTHPGARTATRVDASMEPLRTILGGA